VRVGSLFTGIGGFDLGLERAGHDIRWQCEINPFRREVLHQHWPDTPCYEDVCEVAAPDEVDLLCGGFPCQDLSVAGHRAGLDGDRSGLFFECARVADAVLSDGGWLLIENVPGLFSSNGGRDFAIILATLAELGFHDLAWRVLDSRYFGVPQRRRRVFILARRTTGRSASAVLLEPESGGGDTPPRIPPEKEAAGSVADSARGFVSSLTTRYGSSGADDNDGQAGLLIPSATHTLTAEGFDASEDGTGRGTPLTVDASGAKVDADRVRETSGLPRRVDDPLPDGRRYAACGDAITVNVAEWIGRRLGIGGLSEILQTKKEE